MAASISNPDAPPMAYVRYQRLRPMLALYVRRLLNHYGLNKLFLQFQRAPDADPLEVFLEEFSSRLVADVE